MSFESVDQHENEGQPIGQLLDNLGVRHLLDDGDLVSDAVVITTVITEDGSTRLGLTWSEGTDWLKRLGMITAAAAIDNPSFTPPD